MTVPVQTPYNSYTYAGSPVFAYKFQIILASDIQVSVAGVIQSAANYTIAGVGNQTGGSITYTGTLVTGQLVELQRVTVLQRSTDYQSEGDFLAATLNADFDRMWMALQEQQRNQAQSIRVPEAGGVAVLPAAADRKGTFLAFDSVTGALTLVAAAVGSALALAAQYASAAGSSLVGFIQAGVGSATRTVQAKLRELLSSSDFPAWGAQCYAVGAGNFPATGFLGSGNVVVGYNNLLANTTGFANKVFGNNCLQANTTGQFNYAFGDQVLQFCTTGSNNNGFGEFTLGYLTSGGSNSCFGDDNFRYMTTGSFNVGAGSQAGYNNLTGSWNTFVGTYAGRGLGNPPDAGPGVGPSPTFCVAIGGQALNTASGTQNVAVGYNAGFVTTGSGNTYLGTMAGAAVTSGANNVFVGLSAGSNASQLVTSSGSVVVGEAAYTTGSNAVVAGIASVAGANGIAIGQSVTVATNSIAIGVGLTVATSNITVIGASNNTGNFFYGGLQPQVDNSFALGGTSARWSQLFAGTATINTSDEREKQDMRPLNDAEVAVGRRLKTLIKAYRWRKAVAEKGDQARLHVGWIAQEVIAAFNSEGLDGFAYGVCCFDQWPERTIHHGDLLGEDGQIERAAYIETVPAGELYGVRHDELLAFIVAAL